MQYLVYFGIALIVFGAAVLAGVVPMAMIVVDTEPPAIVATYPSGTKDDPAIVDTSRDLLVWAKVVDEVSGVDRVVVAVVWGESSYHSFVAVYRNGRWEATIPASAMPASGEFEIRFVAYDKAGNYDEKTVYAVAKPLTEPGRFYVCSEYVTSYTAPTCTEVESTTDTVYLKSNRITFFFVVDPSWRDLVKLVYVRIYRSAGTTVSLYRTLYLSEVSSGVYRATTELPNGRYVASGLVDTSVGSYTLMSVYLPIGVAESVGGVPTARLVVGGVSVAGGVALVAVGARRWTP